MGVEDIVIRMNVEGEEELNQALKIAGLSMRQFNKHLQSNALLLTKNNQVIDKLSGKQLKLGNVMRQGMYQARRFKMEWLSIMFAGMAMSRIFGGLVKSQLQLFGVTDMLNAAWTLVLLPIMEMITPFLYKMLDAFMNIPEGMKLAVGAFVSLATVLGILMTVVGQVFLGIMGFKLLLGAKGLSGTILALKGFVLGLGSTFLIVAGIIIAVAVGIYLAWKTNFLNIRKNIDNFVKAFKQYFGGLISIVKGVLNIIKGIFTGDFETIKKGIMQIGKGLWNMWIGGWKMVGNAIIIIFKGVVKLVYNIFKALIDGIVWAVSKVKQFFGGKSIDFRMPSFQTGGLVTQTGPAFLHRGERVIPKGRAGGEVIFSPTVNINASINNDMDVRMLATKLNEYWVKDFERIAQTRGI